MTVREAIRASLRLLSSRDRRLLGAAVAVQMATSLLDLVGVLLLGAVGALAISTVEGDRPPSMVARVVSMLGLEGLSSGALIGLFAGFAAVLLLAKSVISPLLMARVLNFLSRREALVSARLAKELLSRPLTFVQKRSSQETAAALLQGANAATVTILGQTSAAAGEIALLVVLATVLLLVNPVTALGVIVFFAIVSFGLQRILGDRAAYFGDRLNKSNVASLVAVQETLGTYREITITDRRSLYADRIKGLRTDAARAAAGFQLINMLPKYVSEAALVVGGFLLAGALFATQPVSVAAGTFALFLAAATRIMPSLLRLQTAALSIRNATGSGAPTFALAEDLDHRRDASEAADVHETLRRILNYEHTDFAPTIELKDVEFIYPSMETTAVRRVNLRVKEGQSIALIGRSGAGKSTLADLILGVLQPQAGKVTIGGVRPSDAVRRWPGSVGYVPQDVMLTNDSVRSNVALGLPRPVVNDDQVWDALRRAHLEDYLRAQPDGLDTQIGERGLRLSGGQRQRLGIARALFTKPRLIVLDEATSALDAETEQAITATLEELDENVTTVIIAHRLSTIRNADIVVYLADGEIVASGSFDQVCSQVPALHRQANLMGLRQG
jgi:ABC-type multidrug transport system fused ATPase/permease subunit